MKVNKIKWMLLGQGKFLRVLKVSTCPLKQRSALFPVPTKHGQIYSSRKVS